MQAGADACTQLAESGGGADGRHFEQQRRIQRDAAGEHGLARRALHGRCLASEQGFVDACAGRPQSTIDRHRFAAGHADQVAMAQFAEPDRVAPAFAVDAVGMQVLRAGDQLQSLGRAAAGDGFDMSGRAEQEHEHHRCIEIHDRAAANGLDHRREVGQPDRERDQHVHARSAQREFAPGTAEERQARIEHHRCRHQHRDDAEEVARADVEFAVAPIQRFGEHHRLHRAEPGDRQPFQRLPARACAVGRILHDARRITDGCQSRRDRAQRRARRVEAHARMRGRGIDADRSDARHLLAHTVDQPGARGAANIADAEVALGLAIDLVHVQATETGAVPVAEVLQGIDASGRFAAQDVVIGQATVMQPLGGGATAAAAEGAFATVQRGADQRMGRHDLATVIAGARAHCGDQAGSRATAVVPSSSVPTTRHAFDAGVSARRQRALAGCSLEHQVRGPHAVSIRCRS